MQENQDSQIFHPYFSRSVIIKNTDINIVYPVVKPFRLNIRARTSNGMRFPHKQTQNQPDTKAIWRDMGVSEEQIAELQTRLDALRQSRQAQK